MVLRGIPVVSVSEVTDTPLLNWLIMFSFVSLLTLFIYISLLSGANIITYKLTKDLFTWVRNPTECAYTWVRIYPPKVLKDSKVTALPKVESCRIRSAAFYTVLLENSIIFANCNSNLRLFFILYCPCKSNDSLIKMMNNCKILVIFVLKNLTRRYYI